MRGWSATVIYSLVTAKPDALGMQHRMYDCWLYSPRSNMHRMWTANSGALRRARCAR